MRNMAQRDLIHFLFKVTLLISDRARIGAPVVQMTTFSWSSSPSWQEEHHSLLLPSSGQWHISFLTCPITSSQPPFFFLNVCAVFLIFSTFSLANSGPSLRADLWVITSSGLKLLNRDSIWWQVRGLYPVSSACACSRVPSPRNQHDGACPQP